MIISTVDDAVDGDSEVMITNSGLIQGGENDGLELNNGTIINSGTIISLSSDPEGTPAVEGGPPELDAAIDFDAGTNGNEDGVVMNLAGGLIEGDIAIVASPGNVDSPDTNDGRQEVTNAGTITGRLGDAALLGNGDDLFVQQMGGVVNGTVNLQAGNDEFRQTGGRSSSVTGMIDGGDGIDTATISGIYDADKLVNFENIAFNGVTFSGARTIVGDVTLSGSTRFDLLPNNLFVQGDLTLAQGTIIAIDTAGPITALQFNTPVLVIGQIGNFVNQGAIVNLIEDDLLVDYTVAFGSIIVTPVAVNPGAGSTDINVNALGAQIQAGLLVGNLDAADVATINALPNAAAFEAAAGGLLPHLGTGISREIFESANIASRFLDARFPKEGNGVWGQIAYRSSERDNRSATVSGYESDNYVFTLGADTAVLPGLTVGVVGSYADSDLTETSAAAEQIGIQLYKIGGYAGFQTGSRFFINGEISYISADADTSRTSVLGPITGAFDAEAWNFRAQAGLVYQVTENVTATPTVGINYLEIDFDDYVETGGFGFTVNRQDIQFVEGRLGLRLAGEWDKFTAQVQGNWAYDFDTDRRIVGLNSLTGVSDFALTSDFISESRYEVDAGIGYRFMENGSVDLVYNGEFADEAESHGGLIRVRFGF
jgi:outer membrane autotransporter protein